VGLKSQEHPGIAKGIWLCRFEIQELSHTGIVRTKELLINIWCNWRSFNFNKSVAAEEFSLKG
jgi:hypothetical protein